MEQEVIQEVEQETKKRIRRSKDQIANDKIQKLESKIADYEKKIVEAKKEIEELRKPVISVTNKDVWNKADEYGYSKADVMKLIEKAGSKKNKD